MATPAPDCGVFIDVQEDVITHNGKKCSVRLTRGGIRVGCTTVTIAAARHLMSEYDKAFTHPTEVVLQ